jgi:hypothetical protein
LIGIDKLASKNICLTYISIFISVSSLYKYIQQ